MIPYKRIHKPRHVITEEELLRLLKGESVILRAVDHTHNTMVDMDIAFEDYGYAHLIQLIQKVMKETTQ